MARAQSPALPVDPAPRTSRWLALALALTGLGLSLFLVRLHAQAHAGIASFCAVNEVVNCDRVATSRYSVLLGLPVAAWGVLGYGVAAALAAWTLARQRPHPAWPAGLLFLVSGLAAAASVALALVSELLIGAWCLLCIGSWTVSALMFAAAWHACRPAGWAEAIREDLEVVRGNPRRAALAALVGVAAIAGAAAAWPRYWDQPKPPPRPVAGATPGATPGAAASREVLLFSDFECPFCAQVHGEVKALRAARPDLTIVLRHFPLDQACNPLLKRPFHQGSCELARAAICAEAQGHGHEMEDALFANQKEKRPVEALARELRLDGDRFAACLVDPATARRLEADVAEGLQLGIRATPSFVVGGAIHTGPIPTAALPPPPGAPK